MTNNDEVKCICANKVIYIVQDDGFCSVECLKKDLMERVESLDANANKKEAINYLLNLYGEPAPKINETGEAGRITKMGTL